VYIYHPAHFRKENPVSSTSFRETDVMKFLCDVTERTRGMVSFG
jgi:hypothetical protein